MNEEKKKEGDLPAMQALKGPVLLAICAKGGEKEPKKGTKFPGASRREIFIFLLKMCVKK